MLCTPAKPLGNLRGVASDPERQKRALALGKRLRTRRLELHMNQEDVGRRMLPPTPGNVVSRWERGINLPRDGSVIALAQALEVDANYLWGGNPPHQRTAVETDEVLTRLQAIEQRLERLASIDEHMARLVAAVTGTDELDIIERAGKKSLAALGAEAETPAPKPKAPARRRRATGQR